MRSLVDNPGFHVLYMCSRHPATGVVCIYCATFDMTDTQIWRRSSVYEVLTSSGAEN